MNKKDFDKLVAFSYTGGYLFKPENQNAFDLCDQLGIGEQVLFEPKTPRDIKFHQCYFVLINFIWGYLPAKFQETVPKYKFYHFIKHLKGEYEVVFQFKDGTKMVEYESISFGRMSQETFENYIREQLPWIYENIIGEFYEGETYNGIIETIEKEFEKFLSKL